MKYKIFLLVPLLSACSFSFIKFDDIPLVKATYDNNATKSSVLNAGGKPLNEISLSGDNGTCLDYLLRKNSEQTPFYIVFDKKSNRKQFGYMTCNEAKNRGVFN